MTAPEQHDGHHDDWDDWPADWLERHRFRSLTDLVEQLMPVLEHDEHPYTGEITFSTNHKSEMEGWLVLPMTEADHHLPPGTYTTYEVIEENIDPPRAEEQVTNQWIIHGEEQSDG